MFCFLQLQLCGFMYVLFFLWEIQYVILNNLYNLYLIYSFCNTTAHILFVSGLFPGRRWEHLCKKNPVNVSFLHKCCGCYRRLENKLLRDSPGKCVLVLLHNTTRRVRPTTPPSFFFSLKDIIIGAQCSSAHHDTAWISFSDSGSSGDEYILARSDRPTYRHKG